MSVGRHHCVWPVSSVALAWLVGCRRGNERQITSSLVDAREELQHLSSKTGNRGHRNFFQRVQEIY